MVSESSRTKAGDEVEVQPPAYGDARKDEEISFPVCDGLYILRNKMARTVLEFRHPESGTQCKGWSQHNDYGMGNQLWIVRKSVSKDTYTLRSFKHGWFLDLLTGDPENGTHLIGRPRIEGSPSQEWRIVEQTCDHYTLQCHQTNTLLETPGGDSTNGTKTTCSNADPERDCQLWILDRRSRSGPEIRAIIEQWKPELVPRLLLPHGDSVEYFIPPILCRQQCWKKTNLQSQQVRLHLFDYDVFVIKSKEFIHSWAIEHFPTEIRGFGILFGIIYGEAKKGPKAYNWYLTEDMRSLAFFDPQTGREYSTAALDEFGFEPVFATF